MSRGIGEFDPIQDVIPEWAAIIVALLTQLGDIWFLSLVLVTCYWVVTERRDEVVTIVGIAFAGIGLYRGLKYVFEFPRPDEPLAHVEYLPWMIRPLYEATAFAAGYGFPSGHATNTTIVYFGLAGVLTIGSRRLRYATAAGLVTTVCFTRVALGVHYLVDVVAGVTLGLVFLFVARRSFERVRVDDATLALGLGIAFAGFYLSTSAIDGDAIILLGAALGAFGGWQLVVLGRRLTAVSLPSQAVRPIVVRGSLATAAIAPLVAALEYFPILTLYAAGSGVGFVTATIVTLPVARRSESVNRVWTSLVFWLTMAVLGVRYLLRPSTWRRAVDLGRQFVSQARTWVRERREE